MSFAVWDFIFQPFLFQIRSSGGFYLCRTNLHRSLTPLQQALFCAPLVSFPYPVPKTAHRAAQGRVRFFSPEGAPPPKGGGAGYHLGWVRPARSQPGYAGPTGPVWGFAGVVPLPGLQNCTKGHTGASLVFAHSLALLRENIMLLFRTLM